MADGIVMCVHYGGYVCLFAVEISDVCSLWRLVMCVHYGEYCCVFTMETKCRAHKV